MPIFVRSSFNLLILISRFGKGHGKRPGDGLINNRLQELAGSQRKVVVSQFCRNDCLVIGMDMGAGSALTTLVEVLQSLGKQT